MYPETQDNFWRCVCGRINPLSLAECARCRRERGYVLSELNRKTLGLTREQAYARERRKAKAAAASARAISAEKHTNLYIGLLILASVSFIVLAIVMALAI